MSLPFSDFETEEGGGGEGAPPAQTQTLPIAPAAPSEGTDPSPPPQLGAAPEETGVGGGKEEEETGNPPPGPPALVPAEGALFGFSTIEILLLTAACAVTMVVLCLMLTVRRGGSGLSYF
jgi:hypothetical protein